MNHTTTLFEHETTTGFRWTDRDLAALERLRRSIGTEILRPVVRGGGRELQATQYVGVVRFGSRTVQVLPKIHQSSGGTNEQRAREATRNLLHLLEYAGQLPVREHGLANLLTRDMNWFEILTRLFATHLMEEWQRGPARNYQTIEDELPKLKGKWRLTEQLRRPERKHVFAVAHDEFTADNPLNRVFRFVVERLWRLTLDGTNRQWLGELRQWLDEVSLLPSVTANDVRPSLVSRLNRRFEPLLNLARLFLNNGALQIAAGDLSSFAFLFDMNRVFEGFLVNFIRRNRSEILPPSLCECDLLPQTRGASLHMATEKGRNVFRVKPDLGFCLGDTYPLLLDAKYKSLVAGAGGCGISQNDFNQMFAYAHRYRSPRVLVLYPQTADMAEPVYARLHVADGSGKSITVATIDLRLDIGTPSGRTSCVQSLKSIFAAEEPNGPQQ